MNVREAAMEYADTTKDELSDSELSDIVYFLECVSLTLNGVKRV